MAKKRKAQAQQVVEEEATEYQEESDEDDEDTSSSSSASSSEEEEEEESDSSEAESDSSSSEEEEEEDESSRRESIIKLLEPFNKNQIIDLVKQAANKDPSLHSKVAQLADSDPSHRKIFVHGLSWDATSEQLLSAFKPFGEIEEAKLITDKNTGRAKGYAFVLFKTRAAAKKALKQPQKIIGNRTTSCQLASAGPASADANVNNTNKVNGVGSNGSASVASTVRPGQATNVVGGSPAVMGPNIMNPSGLFMGQSPMMAPGMMEGNYGINTISPSVINTYAPQAAAFQGLGAYQAAQMGQSSIRAVGAAPGAPIVATRPQAGLGSGGTGFPPYLGL